jgi:hypothetical protein
MVNEDFHQMGNDLPVSGTLVCIQMTVNPHTPYQPNDKKKRKKNEGSKWVRIDVENFNQ